jgi:F0F1-type ATP synthase epsilon subunit
MVMQQNMLVSNQMRFFGVLPKLPKMELTMRTPYGTFFQNFSGFGRVYVGTSKGQIAISNKTIPRVYLLPPGEIKLVGLTGGEGKITKSESGEFLHTGGWLFVHDNNSCEINMLECTEKEDFLWENLDKCEETETDSDAGQVGKALQRKTQKILNRRRS